jgi:hypothetical protein
MQNQCPEKLDTVDCPITGVWVRPVFICEWFFSNRPAKVIANAISAGFHLITQRAPAAAGRIKRPIY